MKTLTKLLAACLTFVALLGPATFAPAQTGDGSRLSVTHHYYTLYYRDATSPWVVYQTYNTIQDAQRVAIWLQANWSYQTYIYSWSR